MSILDADYSMFCNAIYEALGSAPKINSAPHFVLSGLIKEDVQTAEMVFHRQEALGADDLQEEETRLAVDADLAGTYTAHDDIDTDTYHDGNDSFLLPQEEDIAYPRLSKERPTVKQDPRGSRTPLYETLEQYLINRQLGPNQLPTAQGMAKIMSVISEIRMVAFEEYKSILADGAETTEQLARAHAYADSYVLKALNSTNISREGTRETVRDLLGRMLGAACDAKLSSVRPSDGLDYAFYGKMLLHHQVSLRERLGG